MFSRVSDFVQDALYRKTANYNASQAVLWGIVNSGLIAILFYDLHYGGFTKDHVLLWWFAFLLCVVCLLNIFIHLKAYLLPLFAIAPLEITEKQRKLLSISESEIGFKAPSLLDPLSTPVLDQSPKLSELFEATIIRTTSSPVSPHSQSLSPGNFSSPDTRAWYQGSPFQTSADNSLYRSSSLSPVMSMNQSANMASVSPSITATSWTYHGNQSPLLDTSYNLIASPKRDIFSPSQLSNSLLGKSFSFATAGLNSSQLPYASSPLNPLREGSRSSITNKNELDNYLKEFREKEMKKQMVSHNENSNGSGNSFWAYSATSNSLNYDLVSSLKQNVYHVALKDAGLESDSSLGKIDDPKMPYYSSSSVSKIWLKRNVTPKDLFKFEENLRIWLAMNILQPLIKMIDSCNEELAAVAPELQIGNVGVDKLKKAAQNISGIKQLNYLIPFLDLTIHQDYLVQRLRELSKGGAISAFQWNAGGIFKGHPWRDEYPTDAVILLHLFSMYMDNHLPPDPTQPDGRVFSNIYVVKTPEKPSTPTSYPCLYLTQINPPHLKVVLPQEEECEVGGGHKNFFHVLILFCHHLAFHQHSHIAGVNLKLSGINLAWVVNAE